MKLITAILFTSLLSAVAVFAAFSAFERISPASEEANGYHPKVELKKIKEDEYLLSVSKAVGHAWLIVCKEERKESEREFRGVIWKFPDAQTEDIERISKIEINDERTIEIRVSEEIVSRAYIAMDFDTPVFDGGFYYTIDIPEFYRELKANKTE